MNQDNIGNFAVHIFGDRVLRCQAVTAHSQGRRWKQRKRKRIRAGSMPWQGRLEGTVDSDLDQCRSCGLHSQVKHLTIYNKGMHTIMVLLAEIARDDVNKGLNWFDAHEASYALHYV